MKKVLGILGLTMALAAVGCGGGPAGSCTTTTSGAVTGCTEYGQGYTASTVMSSCNGTGQTYSATACTATNRVGRCLITATSGGATASATTHFYMPLTTDQAMQACTAAGAGGATTTFTAN